MSACTGKPEHIGVTLNTKIIAAAEPLNHISKISIKKLFGYYNYSFPEHGSLGELVILYADNGAGKTNLLRLIFQILSVTRDQGHKTALADTPFSEFEIGLSNGSVVRAKRSEGLLTGPVTFEISKGRELLARWDFDSSRDEQNVTIEQNIDSKTLAKLPASIRKKIELSKGKQDFFVELTRLDVSCFILTPDRILMGGLERQTTNDNFANVNRRASLSEMLVQNRANSLEAAFTSATDLIRRKVFRGAYSSGDSVNQIYDSVIARILENNSSSESAVSPAKARDALKKTLKALEEDYSRFSDYGLAAKINTGELRSSIDKAKGANLRLINSIIEPYLNSLQARARHLEDVYKILDSFVRNVNFFLRDKKLEFKASTGFWIQSSFSPQRLEVSQLSSGEQQLLLMFCHVLAARDTSSIFIIDEPEISLNIKWQRILVASLLEVAKGSGIQLIFSSHSFEILAKHRDMVVSLEHSS